MLTDSMQPIVSVTSAGIWPFAGSTNQLRITPAILRFELRVSYTRLFCCVCELGSSLHLRNRLNHSTWRRSKTSSYYYYYQYMECKHDQKDGGIKPTTYQQHTLRYLQRDVP